jgi:glycine cleavage system H lipoate-binding protein
MICPFLKEAQVRFCRAASVKKMIPRSLEHTASERCCTPAWVTCPIAQQQQAGLAGQPSCPFLQESLVQYCAASPSTKFIPYSESLLSRCGTESHRYCELYLDFANPESNKTLNTTLGEKNVSEDDLSDCVVDGIRMPAGLYYSANHMWLDLGEAGRCHIGIDGFLAKVLGHVDSISFVDGKDVKRPTAVLTVRGVDLHMVFPNCIHVISKNTSLRAAPERLTADPYTLGWLFEGCEPSLSAIGTPTELCAGLLRGREAREWMHHESQHLSEFVHERVNHFMPNGERMVMDGGAFNDGVVHHLNRDEVLDLFSNFFSPYATWRKSE